MKKLIYTGLAMLMAFALVTCDYTPSALGEIQEGVEYTNVVYSKDGQSLTLYLDEGVPVTDADRALNKDMALSGHNFFEAVFMGNNGTNVIARISWSRGESAAVRGIHRAGTAGVTYASVDPAAVTTTAGAAILFVGRRSDKTLLAVGRLSGVDGGPLAAITPTTKSVTFTIAALKAGALPEASGHVAQAASSFITDNGDIGTVAAASTTMNTQILSATSFPMYILNPASGTTVNGSYTILTTETAAGTPDLQMSAILSSIISGGAPVAEPVFPLFYESGVLKEVAEGLAKGIEITPTAGATTNVVEFEFELTAGEIGINSFYFERPVIALIDAPSSADPIIEPVKWVMRPGFGVNLTYLDNGTYSFGGAILLGIGADEFDPVVIDKTFP